MRARMVCRLLDVPIRRAIVGIDSKGGGLAIGGLRWTRGSARPTVAGAIPVTELLPGRPVGHDAEDGDPQHPQELRDLLDVAAPQLPEPGDEQDPVDHRRDDRRIAEAQERRGVYNDKIVDRASPLQELAQAV